MLFISDMKIFIFISFILYQSDPCYRWYEWHSLINGGFIEISFTDVIVLDCCFRVFGLLTQSQITAVGMSSQCDADMPPLLEIGARTKYEPNAGTLLIQPMWADVIKVWNKNIIFHRKKCIFLICCQQNFIHTVSTAMCYTICAIINSPILDTILT